MVADWTTDSGRVSFSLEGQCDPSLVNAGFRDGNTQGDRNFFKATRWRFALLDQNSLKRAGASLPASARLTSIIEDARSTLILMLIDVTIRAEIMTVV